MATLSVQEAMGFKVDREAVATLVLPQLWAMSIGPRECLPNCQVNFWMIVGVVLNVDQFHRFMEVIRKLGERVAKEHDQFLRDSQRLEDRSANKQNGTAAKSFAGSVDFETLVGTTGIAGKKTESADDPGNWEDDVWGSIFTNGDGVSPCFDLCIRRD
jgi:SCY1-like protein 2